MKKSTWIIIGASVLGAAVLGFILMRRKKTAISEESPIEEEAKPSVTTAPKTAVSSIPALKVVTAQPSVKTLAQKTIAMTPKQTMQTIRTITPGKTTTVLPL